MRVSSIDGGVDAGVDRLSKVITGLQVSLPRVRIRVDLVPAISKQQSIQHVLTTTFCKALQNALLSRTGEIRMSCVSAISPTWQHYKFHHGSL